ncbi:MAG: hypothetical protein O7B26_11330, partial [Planctomycetota bacterium]|nr:hypothetical protein [Planctomycetota bacterium]
MNVPKQTMAVCLVVLVLTYSEGAFAGGPPGEILVTSLDDPGIPGDGLVTLREAIEQADQSPGAIIRFASELAGGSIQILSPLPTISGGGVTIDGDVD